MALLRLPRLGRPPQHSHWQQIKTDKATAALAASTLAIAGAVLVAQYGRLLTRRTHERRPEDGHLVPAPADLITSAPAAAIDTVGVAVEGFGAAPRSEVLLFNLLAGYARSIGRAMTENLDEDGPDMTVLGLALDRADVATVSVAISEKMRGDPDAIRKEAIHRLRSNAAHYLSERAIVADSIRYQRVLHDGTPAPPDAAGTNIAKHLATARFLIVPLPYGD